MCCERDMNSLSKRYAQTMEPYLLTAVLDKRERNRLIAMCQGIFTEQISKANTIDDVDGVYTTGQTRVILYVSDERRQYLESSPRTRSLLVAQAFLSANKDAMAIIDSACRRVGEACGLEYAQLHEVELLATPPQSPSQRPHRDSIYNLLAVFVYIRPGRTGSTWLAERFLAYNAKGKKDRLRKIPYEQYNISPGDGIVMPGMWPHYGPGNESTCMWRYIIFITFALDAEAKQHWSDEDVYVL